MFLRRMAWPLIMMAEVKEMTMGTVHKGGWAVLMGLYSRTLAKVKALPEDFAYRKAIEDITSHRLKVCVEEVEDLAAIEKKLGCGGVERLVEDAQFQLKHIGHMIEWKKEKPKPREVLIGLYTKTLREIGHFESQAWRCLVICLREEDLDDIWRSVAGGRVETLIKDAQSDLKHVRHMIDWKEVPCRRWMLIGLNSILLEEAKALPFQEYKKYDDIFEDYRNNLVSEMLHRLKVSQEEEDFEAIQKRSDLEAIQEEEPRKVLIGLYTKTLAELMVVKTITLHRLTVCREEEHLEAIQKRLGCGLVEKLTEDEWDQLGHMIDWKKMVPNAREVLIGLYTKTLAETEKIPRVDVRWYPYETETSHRLKVCLKEEDLEVIEKRLESSVGALIERAQSNLKSIGYKHAWKSWDYECEEEVEPYEYAPENEDEDEDEDDDDVENENDNSVAGEDDAESENDDSVAMA